MDCSATAGYDAGFAMGAVENVLWLAEQKLIEAGMAPALAESVRHMIMLAMNRYHATVVVPTLTRRPRAE